MDEIHDQVLDIEVWISVELSTFGTILGRYIRTTIQAILFRSELTVRHGRKIIKKAPEIGACARGGNPCLPAGRPADRR